MTHDRWQVSIVALILQTWTTLTTNKTRSLLTMFGIAWGLICLILMNAMNEGMWEAQKQKARTLGQNIMIVWGGTTSKGAQGTRAGRRIALTLEDYIILKRRARYLQRLSPEIIRTMAVQSPTNNGSFDVHGVYPEYMQMRSIAVRSGGRVLHQGDNTEAQRVCILGDEVKEQLFRNAQAIGKTIMIGSLPYLVIGELIHKDQNSDYSGPDKRHIYVPFHAMARDFPIIWAWLDRFQLSDLIVQATSPTMGDAAELEVRRILAEEKGFDSSDKDALPIWNTVQQARFIERLFTSGQIFMGAVAVVTLILGGIGVMNIMLLSVKERTREIGVRKAVGATSRAILLQFFAESILLTLFAGFGGIGLGWGICQLINQLPRIDFFAGMIVSLEVAWVALGFLLVVGVLSSLYPAFMAAVTDPIDALRYE